MCKHCLILKIIIAIHQFYCVHVPGMDNVPEISEDLFVSLN